MEQLFYWFMGAGKEVALFLISMTPLIELRGAVPLGLAVGMPWYEVLLICYIGNLLPIPFLVLFAEKLLDFLCSLRFFAKPTNWYREKLRSKRKRVERYAGWGLFLFVAIPLPGTGAWSGAAVAALLHMKPMRAFGYIALGVIVAGIIMVCASTGVIHLLGI